MDASPLTRIMAALEDGPGTAAELGAEVGLTAAACSSYLHRLWRRGWVDRAITRIRANPVGREGLLYGLPGTIPDPEPRALPAAPRSYACDCAYGQPADQAQLKLL